MTDGCSASENKKIDGRKQRRGNSESGINRLIPDSLETERTDCEGGRYLEKDLQPDQMREEVL